VSAEQPAVAPQIAERLGISTRTADNHLRSVYAKLGISGRVELAACLALPRTNGADQQGELGTSS
jgi:hypothetical protein